MDLFRVEINVLQFLKISVRCEYVTLYTCFVSNFIKSISPFIKIFMSSFLFISYPISLFCGFISDKVVPSYLLLSNEITCSRFCTLISYHQKKQILAHWCHHFKQAKLSSICLIPLLKLCIAYIYRIPESDTNNLLPHLFVIIN